MVGYFFVIIFYALILSSIYYMVLFILINTALDAKSYIPNKDP